MIKQDSDYWFEHGVHAPTRTIYLGGEEVDSDLAENVIKGLHLLDRGIHTPINIILNNPGGDVYHGLAIFDAIEKCKSFISTTVYGHAMSMGSIILQASDERIMSPNATLMIHYGTMENAINDNIKQWERWVKESNRFQTWMEDLYLEKIREKKPKFSKAQIRKMLEFDTFLSAEEAVELGLADKVLGGGNGI